MTHHRNTYGQSAVVAINANTAFFTHIRLLLCAALVLTSFFWLPGTANAAQGSDLESAKALSATYADIAERVSPAVVSILTEQSRPESDPSMGFPGNDDQFGLGPEFFERFFRDRKGPAPRRMMPNQQKRVSGLGSGFIIDKKEGLVITNNHVVDGAEKIKVEMPDRNIVFTAEIVGRDPNSDIAVLRLKDFADADLPQTTMGDSDKLRVGNLVMAIGAPMGLRQTVTTGVVSAKHRSAGKISYEDFIQTDTAINVGNSGGPLVNLDGEIVGINTMIVTRGSGFDGIGFAIPINQAKKVIDQLIANGKVTRGWLGIEMNPDDPDISKEMGHDGSGTLVVNVTPNGPAEKAGLKKGDLIITYDGKAIRDNNHLRYMVADTAPDKQVAVTVIRDGAKQEITITIEPQPDSLFANREGGPKRGGDSAQNEPVNKNSRLGLSVQNLDDELRQQLDLANVAGVVVTDVDPDGPAAEKGLTPGTVILEVDRKPVKNVADFRKIMDEVQDKDKVMLVVKSGPVSRFVIIKMDK